MWRGHDFIGNAGEKSDERREPVEGKMTEIVDSGIVFYGKRNTGRQSCAFADISVLPSGRWLASCRAAPAKAETRGQHVLLSWSDDEGKTWSEAYSPFVPPAVASKPGLFRSAYLTSLGGSRVFAALFWVDHSHPELPFFNAETEGLLDSMIFFSRSQDNGMTWSVPQLMDTSPFHVPVGLTGPVMVLHNGEWACQFELNKHYDDTSVRRHAAVLMFSRDQGKTWPEYGIAANDPENRIVYWDQRPGVLKDGRIVNLFWTYHCKEHRYLGIHGRESRDNGRTWSEPWDTGVSVQPARPVSLCDGRIAMIYVDRSGAPEIKIRLSSNDGRTFPVETECTVYRLESARQSEKRHSVQDTWAEMERFSLGLPVTASLPDGDILVLFYAGREPDVTDIRWVRVKIQ